jgi:hypothetical protein
MAVKVVGAEAASHGSAGNRDEAIVSEACCSSAGVAERTKVGRGGGAGCVLPAAVHQCGAAKAAREGQGAVAARVGADPL